LVHITHEFRSCNIMAYRWRRFMATLTPCGNRAIASGATLGLAATASLQFQGSGSGVGSLSCSSFSGYSSSEKHQRTLQEIFGYSSSGTNPSLPMTTDVKLGSYKDIVQNLRSKLHPYVSKGKNFEIAVFGHGGRDTTCCLALVDAVAGDELLRKTVKINHYSCSWTTDDWEHSLARYYEHLASTGKIEKDAVRFVVMKYHEDHDVLVARVRSHIAGVDCIVQCEQGVDMFVEPITGEWLQDNYEDFVVHNLCLAYAEQARIPAFLVQTNADLDVGRGIDGDDVSAMVFEGSLQMRNTFNIGLAWKPGKAPNVEAFRGDAMVKAKQADIDITSVIDLALNTSWATNKRAALSSGFGFDVEKWESLQKDGFYPSYIAFAGALNTSISVAGVLEVFNALWCRGHDLPFVLPKMPTDGPPQPQWVAAKFLQPSEVKDGLVRVASQFRRAGLDSALDCATFWSRWMFHRGLYGRVRGQVVEEERYNHAFWTQLEKAKAITEEVRRECPDFELWPNGSPLFLEGALRKLKTSANLHRDECKHIGKTFESQEKAAQMLQPDFVKLSPLAAWTAVNRKMVLDFTCRLLESPLGIENEYRQIASGLQPLPSGVKEKLQKPDKYENLFKDALITAWQEERRPAAKL